MKHDRKAFERHPDRDAFIRRLFPGEVPEDELQRLADQGQEIVMVYVQQVIPGVRMKRFLTEPIRPAGTTH